MCLLSGPPRVVSEQYTLALASAVGLLVIAMHNLWQENHQAIVVRLLSQMYLMESVSVRKFIHFHFHYQRQQMHTKRRFVTTTMATTTVAQHVDKLPRFHLRSTVLADLRFGY